MLRVFTCAVAAVLAGIGGGFTAAQDAVKPWDPSLGTAEIKGTITFTGTRPKRRAVDFGADEPCSKMHEKRPLDETVIVNKTNGGLQNVFVWIKKGLDGWRFAAPKEAVVLTQQGCMFVPHVFGIMVGQDLKIRNDDDTLHNIHTLSRLNPEWNFGQPKKGMEDIKKFANPEVMVKFKCDVHGWMHAYVGVTRHPYYSVTGEDGSFKLPKVPPGEYTIEAWHEKYGSKTLTVKVADKETKEGIDFTFGEQ